MTGLQAGDAGVVALQSAVNAVESGLKPPERFVDVLHRGRQFDQRHGGSVIAAADVAGPAAG